jgi:F-box-like
VKKVVGVGLSALTSSAPAIDQLGTLIGSVQFNQLPDDIILEIFDFYRVSSTTSKGHTAYTWPWKRLVHVCQKWRTLVFASSHRLDLRLFCDSRTPVRKSLDYWPSLPIIIRSTLTSTMFTLHDRENGENIVAALEQRDRVCKVELKNLTSYLLNSFSQAMQEPFPALAGIFLSSHIDAEPVLPDKFLGTSAPNLQYFDLDGISFSALPKLLSSATHLNRLQLRKIPCTGYISPEAMATCLSALSNLESLVLEFQSPRSHPTRDSRPPSPLIRAALPALTSFDFQGVSEYLEDLVTHMDAPLLNRVTFRFFNQLTFDNPQLSQFIDRTRILKSLNLGSIEFLSDVVKTTFTSLVGRGKLELGISCCRPDWQVSSMAQLCAQLPALTSRVEQLDVRKGCISRAKWPEDMESAQWLELFDPFVAVERLSILKLGQLVVPALGELTRERASDILPAMRRLLFRGLEANSLIKDDLKPFVSARRSSNHPISVLWGLK